MPHFLDAIPAFAAVAEGKYDKLQCTLCPHRNSKVAIVGNTTG
jgi:hypothetical protein